jgi:N-dimethylarginine dimethylaminohydrolase
MNNRYGAQSMVTPIRRVVVRRPDEAFGRADPDLWHYTARPLLEVALEEHQRLVELLEENGSEVIYHDEPAPDLADSIYVHDPVLVADQGAILLRMGKELRRGEESAIGHCLESAGIRIHYRLHGEALAEAGDLVWLDHDTLAVGLGYRTNRQGLLQLQEALPGIEFIPVQLPYYLGPEACLHLMSTVSLVDDDLAVIYKPLTSVPFIQELQRRGFELVEVPEEEFDTMGPNVLAVAPRRCIMLEGNPITKSRLEATGCHVDTYLGHEISLKAEGGPTCLTRPVWREATAS